jgi:hypothetical protein
VIGAACPVTTVFSRPGASVATSLPAVTPQT